MADYKKYLLYIEHIFIICIIAFLIWTNFGSRYKKNDDENKTKEIRQSGYDFVNPLLECEVEGEQALKSYVPFEKKIKNRVNEEIILPNKNMHLSVYFRNLNNGPWFGINEKEYFSPASLLKVPIMIAYFKEMEENSELADREIFMDENRASSFRQDAAPSNGIETEKKYTVENLIERMIVHSDNDAMSLLLDNISPEKLIKVYADLGVVAPDDQNIDNFMSVKDYASFFRILYNAAYLEKKSSEKALKLLSKSDFKGGLVAGMPENIKISHKFGERGLEEASGYKRQLHDCGIVYYEKYPYLLCVMTRGDDLKKLSSVIAGVSKIVFEEISADFPEEKK